MLPLLFLRRTLGLYTHLRQCVRPLQCLSLHLCCRPPLVPVPAPPLVLARAVVGGVGVGEEMRATGCILTAASSMDPMGLELAAAPMVPARLQACQRVRSSSYGPKHALLGDTALPTSVPRKHACAAL